MNQFINTRYNPVSHESFVPLFFHCLIDLPIRKLGFWSCHKVFLFKAMSSQKKNSCMQTVNEPWKCSPKTSSAVCLHQSHRWTEAYKYPQKRTRVHAGAGRLSAHTRMHVRIWSPSKKGHRRLICPSCFLLKDCNWGWQRSECRWPILDYTAEPRSPKGGRAVGAAAVFKRSWGSLAVVSDDGRSWFGGMCFWFSHF